MRVIAGTARGRTLKAPPGLTARPTSDRVKESLFNILGPKVPDAVVLDLFAGSGALGIEALSRGAAYCYFLEKNRRHCRVIAENLLRIGLERKAAVLCHDVFRILPRLAAQTKVDLVLVDPPYGLACEEEVLAALRKAQILSPSALVAVEHSSRNQQWAEGYPQKVQKKYGDTVLTFLSAEEIMEGARSR